jgi:nucleotide-binding universal stress UspA family protein
VAFHDVAVETEQVLRRRWPEAAAVVVGGAPVDVILKSARGARVVVLGSHGYSKVERWVLGSVTRAIVRRATTSVLVVKQQPDVFRHVAIAYDGSNHARRAIDMVASLSVPSGGRITLFSYVEPVEPQVPGLLPRRIKTVLASEAKAFMRERLTKSRRALERAARPLVAAGWRVRLDVRSGHAARDVPTMPAELHADLLVLGAQGTGWKRLLLGSVVEAVLDRVRVSVLIVR